jgi:hypothetical protein
MDFALSKCFVNSFVKSKQLSPEQSRNQRKKAAKAAFLGENNRLNG